MPETPPVEKVPAPETEKKKPDSAMSFMKSLRFLQPKATDDTAKNATIETAEPTWEKLIEDTEKTKIGGNETNKENKKTPAVNGEKKRAKKK